jgi:protein-L-isoaspartate(D-aspartate) O-methyltransferase
MSAMRGKLFSLIALLSLAGGCAAAARNSVAEQRAEMIETIRGLAAVYGPEGHRALDPAVLEAMGKVERHRFVPEHQQPHAYEDRPLSIGHDQTISQPYIVALMTHLLRPEKNDVVLEVGTGSGYQAAVLSPLVARVHTIEIVAPLAHEAAERLRALGYRNVTVRAGDGYAGWPEHGPFDRIIVTAGAKSVPAPLLAQLKPGGRMVIPVGTSTADQQLLLIEKRGDGQIVQHSMGGVRFVPLTGRGLKD